MLLATGEKMLLADYPPPPVTPSTWRYYEGMSREHFDELREIGLLPIAIPNYDEVQRIVAERRASES
jgi:hypothetical protein